MASLFQGNLHRDKSWHANEISRISYYTVELLLQYQEVSEFLVAITKTSNDTFKSELGMLDELSALKSSNKVFCDAKSQKQKKS